MTNSCAAEVKDSGIEWLGEMPAHWEVKRLRNLMEMRVSNVDKHTKEGEQPVRLCNYVDVYKNDCIDQQINFMQATATLREIERFRLRKGDVLITKDSEAWDDIGAPALVTEPADDLISGYHLALLRPFAEVLTGQYLLRLLQSKVAIYQFGIRARGVTRYALLHGDIKSVRLPVPPLAEQRAIADFLDRETARIDALIERKQRQVALLKEKRSAQINHVVTRGLNPDVEMRDSGIEWLGEIPAHWEVKRLRNLMEMRVSNVDKHTKEGEQPVRLCNYVDVYKNDYIDQQINFMQATATLREIERFRLKKGDVLITKDSEAWDDIGAPALVTEPADDLISGYHLALLRPFAEVLTGQYLLRLLQSKVAIYQFSVRARGVTRYALLHGDIKSVRLPVPPLAEQQAIADFLDRETAHIDALVGRIEQSVELLRERRAALITAAVTGGIDVREEARDS